MGEANKKLAEVLRMLARMRHVEGASGVQFLPARQLAELPWHTIQLLSKISVNGRTHTRP